MISALLITLLAQLFLSPECESSFRPAPMLVWHHSGLGRGFQRRLSHPSRKRSISTFSDNWAQPRWDRFPYWAKRQARSFVPSKRSGEVSSGGNVAGVSSGGNVWRIQDCMTVSSKEEGTWEYRSDGRSETCGLYLVTRPDQLVEITIHDLEVDCDSGLVVVFDGWELNGNVFPGETDHQLGLDDRSQILCNSGYGKKTNKRVFVSHQNAALVSFKIPEVGQGFKLSVKFIDNKNPCNILMSDMAGLFTLKTKIGTKRNCSLTTLLFPASFSLLSLNVGSPNIPFSGRQRRETGDRGISSQCFPDFVELGGSSELDSSRLSTSETLCGTQSTKDPEQSKNLTVLCGSSTVRLVSSGKFDNEVVVLVKAATEDDLDFHRSVVITCPEFVV